MAAVSKLSLHQRLIQFHEQVGTIRKTATNPHFRSNYADINAVLSTIMPILTSVGIVLTQRTDILDSGSFILNTVVSSADDKEDAIVSCTPLLMPDKTNPQKYGSALTYARRYALMCMFDLEAEDDDGNNASGYTQQNYNQQGR